MYAEQTQLFITCYIMSLNSAIKVIRKDLYKEKKCISDGMGDLRLWSCRTSRRSSCACGKMERSVDLGRLCCGCWEIFESSGLYRGLCLLQRGNLTFACPGDVNVL